jgi:hypothetical protein
MFDRLRRSALDVGRTLSDVESTNILNLKTKLIPKILPLELFGALFFLSKTSLNFCKLAVKALFFPLDRLDDADGWTEEGGFGRNDASPLFTILSRRARSVSVSPLRRRNDSRMRSRARLKYVFLFRFSVLSAGLWMSVSEEVSVHKFVILSSIV